MRDNVYPFPASPEREKLRSLRISGTSNTLPREQRILDEVAQILRQATPKPKNPTLPDERLVARLERAVARFEQLTQEKF